MLPKKNPVAQGNGLSSDTAKASATTLSGFQDPGADGANHEGTPVNLHFGNIAVLNHGYLLERYSLGFQPFLKTTSNSLSLSLRIAEASWPQR